MKRALGVTLLLVAFTVTTLPMWLGVVVRAELGDAVNAARTDPTRMVRLEIEDYRQGWWSSSLRTRVALGREPGASGWWWAHRVRQGPLVCAPGTHGCPSKPHSFRERWLWLTLDSSLLDAAGMELLRLQSGVRGDGSLHGRLVPSSEPHQIVWGTSGEAGPELVWTQLDGEFALRDQTLRARLRAPETSLRIPHGGVWSASQLESDLRLTLAAPGPGAPSASSDASAGESLRLSIANLGASGESAPVLEGIELISAWSCAGSRCSLRADLSLAALGVGDTRYGPFSCGLELVGVPSALFGAQTVREGPERLWLELAAGGSARLSDCRLGTPSGALELSLELVAGAAGAGAPAGPKLELHLSLPLLAVYAFLDRLSGAGGAESWSPQRVQWVSVRARLLERLEADGWFRRDGDRIVGDLYGSGSRISMGGESLAVFAFLERVERAKQALEEALAAR